jgi:hypothetical protein
MSDIYEDIRIVVQRHREQAAAEERAKIVAWLMREEEGPLAKEYGVSQRVVSLIVRGESYK